MNDHIDLIKYTKEDLLSLKDFLVSGSSIEFLLEEVDYDPERFCKSLSVLKKEWDFIYKTPLNELPLTMNDQRFEGWRRWRFCIGK